jgi:hypothetical protein
MSESWGSKWTTGSVDGNGVIVDDDDELRTIQNVILFLCLFMFPEKNDVMIVLFCYVLTLV